MTFPTRNTRKIVVDGELYFWHRNRNFDIKNSWTVIRKAHCSGQLLLLDSYNHAATWGPGDVQRAIRFALLNTWHPDTKAAPMKLKFNDAGYDGAPFSILPSNSRPAEAEPERASVQRDIVRREFQQKVSTWVQKQRRMRHMSRNELNRRLLFSSGSTQKHLRALDSGEEPVTWSLITRLAKIFAVTPEQLLSEVEFIDPLAITHFQLLSPEQQQRISKLVQESRSS